MWLRACDRFGVDSPEALACSSIHARALDVRKMDAERAATLDVEMRAARVAGPAPPWLPAGSFPCKRREGDDSVLQQLCARPRLAARARRGRGTP